MTYACQHTGDGYLTETESHHGEYPAWVCGECGHEVPIDYLPINHEVRKRLSRTGGQH